MKLEAVTSCSNAPTSGDREVVRFEDLFLFVSFNVHTHMHTHAHAHTHTYAHTHRYLWRLDKSTGSLEMELQKSWSM